MQGTGNGRTDSHSMTNSLSAGLDDDSRSKSFYASYSYESISEAVTRRRPLATKTAATINDTIASASGDDRAPGSSSSSSTFASRTNCHRLQRQGNTNDDASASPSERVGQHHTKLRRTLSLADLIFYGVGCSVGAGIYSLVGIGAKLAGPGVAVSFLFTGISCCFTSLAYAEFASLVPLSGSAYTFTYVSFGELAGWLVGWNLTLGYAISASVVARSWASYVVEFISGMLMNDIVGDDGTDMASSYTINSKITASDGRNRVQQFLQWSIHAPVPYMEDFECCPLATVIVGFCTFILITGAKESSRFNTVMTILNLTVLGFVVVSGFMSDTIQLDNLQPFFPHGFSGVGRAAGLVFFSYLGFDMVSCLSEEVKNPERNLPIGIIGSLFVSMTIYTTVSLAVVGMAPISILGENTPIVNALLGNGCCTNDQMQQLQHEIDHSDNVRVQQCLSYSCEPIVQRVLFVGSRIVSAGAMFGLTTATFSCLMGQPRIFYSMAVDGLLFKVYAKVSPRTGVPTIGTVLTGIATALVACFIDLESLANVISLGTLMVFTFVNAGVIILRTTPPVLYEDNQNDANKEITDEDQELIADAALGMSTKTSTFGGSSAPHERSPLVRNPEAAIVARSLGLIKKSSREIRADLKHGTIDAPFIERLQLEQNGILPHLLTFWFTVLAIIGSIGINHTWNHWFLLTVGTLMTILMLMVTRLYQVPPSSSVFSCPFVPYVPLVGIMCNAYMMGSMPLSTWSAITGWLLIGLVFYFSYGMHHSELRDRKKIKKTSGSLTAEKLAR